MNTSLIVLPEDARAWLRTETGSTIPRDLDIEQLEEILKHKVPGPATVPEALEANHIARLIAFFTRFPAISLEVKDEISMRAAGCPFRGLGRYATTVRSEAAKALAFAQGDYGDDFPVDS